MRPTEEQIRQAAEKFIAKKGIKSATFIHESNAVSVFTSYEVISSFFSDFAKTLFKETEEETWERIDNDEKSQNKTMFEICQLFYKERTRIENE